MAKGLVVTGESGGGKTALLAAWARDWAKNHPEDFLFQHYFGATPDSASPEGFLRRLLGELKSRFGITDDIPTDPEKLRDALPVWLAQACTLTGGPDAARKVAASSSCSTASTRCKAASPTAACSSCRGTSRRTSWCSPPPFPARRWTPCANAAGRNMTCRAPARPRWTPWSASTLRSTPAALEPDAAASIGHRPRREEPALPAHGARGTAPVRQFRATAPARRATTWKPTIPKDLFLRVLPAGRRISTAKTRNKTSRSSTSSAAPSPISGPRARGSPSPNGSTCWADRRR